MIHCCVFQGRDGAPGLQGEKGLPGIPGKTGRQGLSLHKELNIIRIDSIHLQDFRVHLDPRAMQVFLDVRG